MFRSERRIPLVSWALELPGSSRFVQSNPTLYDDSCIIIAQCVAIWFFRRINLTLNTLWYQDNCPGSRFELHVFRIFTLCGCLLSSIKNFSFVVLEENCLYFHSNISILNFEPLFESQLWSGVKVWHFRVLIIYRRFDVISSEVILKNKI